MDSDNQEKRGSEVKFTPEELVELSHLIDNDDIDDDEQKVLTDYLLKITPENVRSVTHQIIRKLRQDRREDYPRYSEPHPYQLWIMQQHQLSRPHALLCVVNNLTDFQMLTECVRTFREYYQQKFLGEEINNVEEFLSNQVLLNKILLQMLSIDFIRIIGNHTYNSQFHQLAWQEFEKASQTFIQSIDLLKTIPGNTKESLIHQMSSFTQDSFSQYYYQQIYEPYSWSYHQDFLNQEQFITSKFKIMEDSVGH